MPIFAVFRLGLPFAAGLYGSIVSLGYVLVVFVLLGARRCAALISR